MENELWKDITGFEGLYQVSNKGKVRSLDRLTKTKTERNIKGRMLAMSVNGQGYRQVALYKNGVCKIQPVHRLVINAFSIKSNPEFDVVNHIDGVKTNNNINNLEWTDYKGNSRHAHANNLFTYRKGTKHHNSKLTEKEVLEIRLLCTSRKRNLPTKRKIAELYNIHESIVGKIHKETLWKSV